MRKLNSGAYQLFIKVKKSISISIGALGTHSIEKGIYVYTGSAMKNLDQRVARHERLNHTKDKSKLRWHIDYLLTNDYVEIIEIKKYRSIERQECELNLKLLKKKGNFTPIIKFGSSDCKVCNSHLIQLNDKN